MKKILMSVFCLVCAWIVNAQNPRLTQQSIPFAAAPNHNIYFYQYTPPTFNNTDLFPLIISLHGGGQAGDNSGELNNVLGDGLPFIVNGVTTGPKDLVFTWQGKTEGFVMLAPQATRNEVSNWPTYYVDQMITYGINNLRVDPNRIFLVGYSFGGTGTWNYATSSAANAAKLAGIVPAAPIAANGNFCNIAQNKVAVWAFHGKGDNEAVTVNAVNAINACSGLLVPAVDTVYPDGGHDIYNPRVYDITNNTHYPNIYQWMLKVNRNLNPASNSAPVPVIAGSSVVNLTAPVKVKDFPLLDGTGSSDNDDIIMDYLWEQTGGPLTLLPASSANQWPTVKASSGQIGVPVGTYNFRLRVKDYLTSKPNHTQFATKTINVVLPASGHAAPVTDGGGDFTLGNTQTTLARAGSASAIYGGTINGYNWTFISGPQTAILKTFDGSAPYAGGTERVMFTNMNAAGVYIFEFTATTTLGDVGTDRVAITKLASAALPVNYAYINGKNAGDKNVIAWATTAEVNSDRFDILRSTDGINFTVISSVSSRGGATVTEYSFDDNNAPPGVGYYRLSQVDKDGHSSLSQIISVSNRKAGIYIEKYPNPVHGSLSVTVQGNTNGNLQVTIADMQGKTIMQQQWQKDQSLLKKVVNVAALKNGVYQMIITIGQEKQISSFVKD